MWSQRKQKHDQHQNEGEAAVEWRSYRASHLQRDLEIHRKGEPSLSLNPGELLLIQCPDTVGKLVRLGEAVRAKYRTEGYAAFDHCALAINSSVVIEADRHGIHSTNIRSYEDALYVVVSYHGDHLRREAAVAFAAYRRTEGTQGRVRYGFVTAFFLAFRVWFRSPVTVLIRNTDTCAQLVAESLAHAGMIFRRDPADMLPADFAREFKVRGC
jgi:hypothetical protein